MLKNKSLFKNVIVTVLIYLSSFAYLYAQDIIYTKDGREIEVSILESSGSNIRYRNFDDPNSPIRTFDTQFIDYIKYENGTIERFVINKNINEKPEIIQEDETLTYLKQRYERVLISQKVLSTIGWGLAATSLTGLISMSLADDIQTIHLMGDIALYSFVALAVLSIPQYILRKKSEYINNRINQLSFYVVPNSPTLFAIEHLNPNCLSIGFRINF